MVKRLVYIIAFLALGSTAYAQVGFKAEPIVGLGFYQVDGDHIAGYNKTGVNLGLGIYLPVRDNLDVGLELTYTQKGSKRPVNPEDPNPPIFILQFDYVEFPFVAIRKYDKFTVHGGVTYGVNVRSLLDEGAGFKETSINRSEVGYILGAGFDFAERSSVVLRHQQSLFRIAQNYPNGLNIFNRIGLYNRGFTVQYRYRLGS